MSCIRDDREVSSRDLSDSVEIVHVMDLPVEDNESISYTQKVIIPLSILTGLSCWIPVPFLDDMVGTFLRFQMIDQIVRHRGYELSRDEINAMAGLKEPGCLVSCLTIVFVAPLKFLLSLVVKIFRMIFFYLEIKRAVDLTSRVLVYCFLLDWILKDRMWDKTDCIRAGTLSKIIHESCSEVGTKPLEGVISSAFSRGKETLLQVSRFMRRTVLRIARHLKKEKVKKALEEMEPENEKDLESIVKEIFDEMGQLHETYFNRLRDTFLEKLEREIARCAQDHFRGS